MLRPIDTGSRERRSLNGLWRFQADAPAQGWGAEWWRRRLGSQLEMPVPASYNDIPAERGLRDHVGDVWYQTDAMVPLGWRGRRIVLRLDSATHRGTVFVGDTQVAGHQGGYTPFEADVTAHVTPGEPVQITVCVNNELSWSTIPPGEIETAEDGRRVQRCFHDFFNYAGLHRTVWLYSTPFDHIEDITVVTDLQGTAGLLDYRIETEAGGTVEVELYDADAVRVASGSGAEGRLRIPAVHPWAPGDGYLYTLRARLRGAGGGTGEDRYDLPVGVRTVAVDGTRFLINGRPFRFRGFGRHEDGEIRGKAHDDALMVHDFALMEWIGANSFRTSHYPYAEEVMEYADRRGVVVIDETPAVGLNLKLGVSAGAPHRPTYAEATVSGLTQQAHLQSIRELIARDKNHPSVVMWSLANEPDSVDPAARGYFAPLVDAARRLDPSRPLCFANCHDADSPGGDSVSDLFDVLCINRYYGWYVDTGDLASAERHLEAELRAWSEGYSKPIVITEYGADAVAGLRAVAGSAWTEEYQRDLLAMHHRVLDRVEAVVGEQVWNFADFGTGTSSLHRVDGNRKGVFTRDRRPKLAAYALRERWTAPD